MQIVIYLICVLYEATWAEKNVLTSASESGVYFYGETAERVMNILLKGNQRNILPSVSRPKDCSYLDKKLDKSGVYKIYPDNGTGFDVFCEMEVDGGGWTVFVNRMDGSESFNRKWKDYEIGFGNLKKEFWLGNTNLHRLTSRVNTEMRVEMKNFKGEKRFAKYSTFKVGDAASKYKLTVKGFTGNAGDAMRYHNGLAFSTKDKDNDRNRSGNCAQTGGWWFHWCDHVCFTLYHRRNGKKGNNSSNGKLGKIQCIP